MNGSGNVVESAVGSGLGKKILDKASKATTESFNYLTNTQNAPTIVKCLVFVGSSIVGLDYVSAEATHKTSYATKIIEVKVENTYSPDPDTRSKAAALRRRGVNLLDCCEPNSRCLNLDLVDSKYGHVKPYESKRYLALEEKATALEEENRKLRLKEDSSLK